MLSLLNSNPTNSKFNDYLSVCDLINKYNLKNIKESPKLSKIIFEFSSSDILFACENGSKKELDAELQIKAFFLLYILECQKPFVNLNKIKIIRESSLNYSVKIILSSKAELDLFLKSLFVENWNLLLAEDFRLIKSAASKHNQYIQQNKKFMLNVKIPATAFFELDAFLNKKLFGLSSKSLKVGVNFVFNNNTPDTKNMCSDLIRNLPLFWITNIENNKF